MLLLTMALFVFTLLCTMHVCCVFLIKYSVFSIHNKYAKTKYKKLQI